MDVIDLTDSARAAGVCDASGVAQIKANPYLCTYLDDHWAGAGAGTSLARTLARRNDDTAWASELADIAMEIVADEQELERLRSRLGRTRGAVKRGLALASERIRRLKPNGSFTGYSPLDRVLEIEALMSGVVAKRQLWASLDAVADRHPVHHDFAHLYARADDQLERLRRVHTHAARLAFSSDQR